MRLIYVTSSFPFGPGEAFVLPEIDSLQKMGHKLLLVPLWPHGSVVHEDAQRWLSQTLTTPLISPETMRRFARTVSQRLSEIGRLGFLFAGKSPSITVKNLAALPKAAWLAQCATEWHVEHIHAFWASTVATLAMGAAELSGIPWSFTAHRFDIVQDNLLRQKAERAQFVRFISESGLRMSGLMGTGLDQKMKLLHLGVAQRDRAPNSNQHRSVVALCAGSLIPVKAHAVLIGAIDRLRQRGCALELWLAGEGKLRDALQFDVRRRGLENQIKFLGSLSHTALMNLYAARTVDIAVLASADLGNGLHEGIPASLMEAMSFGVPAIGTITGGIPELLAGGAGLLVPPNDSGALADALQLLAENQRVRESLGRAGLKRIQDSFAAANIAAEMSRLFSPGVDAAVSHLA